MATDKQLKTTFFLLLIIIISLTACTSMRSTIQLPLPDNTCKAKLDWHGLTPGQSTREDVLEALGTPIEKGKLRFDHSKIAYYAYKVNGGEISNYAFDRIFFRSDGLIDWMEIIEADRNGKFNTVFDVVTQLGNNLDTIYSNNNYRPEIHLPDILAGPDRIYVWSECGLALDVLPSTYSHMLQGTVACQSDSMEEPCNLVTRYPNPHNVGGEPQPDVNSVILMRFYFQPTSYEAFTQLYMYKIPYGLWNEYLAKSK